MQPEINCKPSVPLESSLHHIRRFAFDLRSNDVYFSRLFGHINLKGV